jgi:hypothetical protein
MKTMNMQQWMLESYNADKSAIEADYEQLMKQAQAHHQAYMDAYAAMYKTAVQRLNDRYGVLPVPPKSADEKTTIERANYEENTAQPL